MASPRVREPLTPSLTPKPHTPRLSRHRLAYLPCRNRCEVPRLILEEAGCAYDFEVVGFAAWRASVKAQTPHGKLPVLWDYDGAGTCLSQEQTITRFLAQRVGLAGRSAMEQAAVDMWYSQLFCTLRNNGVSHDGEHYSVRALKQLAAAQAAQAGEAEAEAGAEAVAKRSFALRELSLRVPAGTLCVLIGEVGCSPRCT